MSRDTNYRTVLYANYTEAWAKWDSPDDLYDWLEQSSKALANEFVPMLPADKNCSILDVGCGYGPLLYALKQRGYENFTGIDGSAVQVELAHKIGLPSVKHVDALEFINSSKQHYDVIFGVDLIEHFDRNELIELLQAMRSILRPGGKLILRTPNVDAPMGKVHSFGDLTHELHLNKLSALELFKCLHFNEVEVLPSPVHAHSPGRELLRSVIWGLLQPVLKAMVFTSGIRQRDVILTPNMVIRAGR